MLAPQQNIVQTSAEEADIIFLISPFGHKLVSVAFYVQQSQHRYFPEKAIYFLESGGIKNSIDLVWK
jgi:hypothetical protein